MDAVEVAADVHVGTPPGQLSSWVMRKVHFHGFAGLPTARDEEVKSPEFSCFDRRWTVEIMPGGEGKSEEGYVSVYLHNQSQESIQAEYRILLKHPTDQAKWTFEANVNDEMVADAGGSGYEVHTFEAKGLVGAAWGTSDFAKRDEMLTYLNNGTLTLEIHLRRTNTNKQTEPISFVPSNPINDNILKCFNNEEKSDLKFEVGGEAKTASNRRKHAAKSTATVFHANHVILGLNAPALADMCKPGDEAAVPINGVKAEVFKTVLYFCYGGTVSENELSANAKAIIEAADRFGITNITVDDMLDNLLYANSKNLALFQEKIMDFVAVNGGKIVGNVSFSSVPSELMSDLLTAVARGQIRTGEVAPEDDLKFMRVGELRKRLHDKGLCVDGSRETMIALLKENTEGDDNENS